MGSRQQLGNYSLWMLSWPIFIELFLQFLLGAADTLMVSKISDDAVAVVGFSNQLFNALMALFTTVSSGAGILIAQRLGARDRESARTLGVIALKVTALIGVVISVALIAAPRQIAMLLQLPDRLLPLAEIYISIVGGGMVLTAVMTTLSTSIRNTGNTKAPMYIAVGMNIVHLFLNSSFIFGHFGFPQLGLTGVAISTVTSRLLATIVLFYIFLSAFHRPIRLPDFKLFDRKLFHEVLKIGWPLGVNMSCWVFSQLAIFSFLAMLGSAELTARTYMNTLESFCFLLGQSIAMGVQIQVAHLFGAKRTKEAYRSAYRGLYIGLVIVSVNAVIVYFVGDKMLGFFTSDPHIIALGVSLLSLNLLLQPGKMLNMALGNSLSAIGDTRFMMTNSLISMSLIATLLSYVLGVKLGWGLSCIYSCMIADEYFRGIIALFRWRGRKKLRQAEIGMQQAARQAVAAG
ncbi:MATE family efflux transporter [Paenibacillus protaetiae]|uniref:MATE family efflux transporter n=1 Tax=Paenibacillus protaetiae TaxID=2509456 RepID=A0A4P6EV66_9BACL|nr:MATE family efflux transporter [Paenibacillus protaetiae]QAY67170.1 MATE family efflux transporter [Paenibacillus protaetiae]